MLHATMVSCQLGFSFSDNASCVTIWPQIAKLNDIEAWFSTR